MRIPLGGAQLTVAAALMTSTLTGCAALTESQVREVKEFAKASSDYSQLPGAVLQAYGRLRRDLILLDASRKKLDERTPGGTLDPEAADGVWKRVLEAHGEERSFEADGEQFDAQLRVLRQYSEILETVVSDSYTDALGKSAANLGKSLDEATKAYNEKYRAGEKPIAEVGGKIAQAIRAVGGIYLRHRQAQILRDTVEHAHPLIEGLMDDVAETAGRIADSFANQEKRIGPLFVSVGTRAGRVDVEVLSAVYDDLVRARAGRALADQVGQAAGKYKAAHARLLEEISKRKELSEFVEEIKALQEEIKAAKKVRSEVEGD